jgi:amino acid transporter
MGVRVSSIDQDPIMSGGSPLVLKREFTFGSALGLAFSFISPIVALYTVFALALEAGGAAAWWAFPISIILQLSVALVFAELVAVWPLAGGVYQWTRALVGSGPGWFAGWTYAWTLVCGLATVSYGGGQYLGALLGYSQPNGTLGAVLALAVLAFVTVVNTVGRRFMNIIVAASIFAEVVGSLGIGTWLLLFHRVNSLSVLVSSNGTSQSGFYLGSGAFAGVMAFVCFSFFGFESAGSIAEEVVNARQIAPKALILSLLLVGGVVMYSGLALILAIPDIQSVVAGTVSDPVVVTLTAAFGAGIVKPLLALFVTGFVAAAVAIQAGASRVIFGLARDGALPGSRLLSRLSEADALPVNAILLIGALVAALFLVSGATIYAILIAFCEAGFFLTFLFPITASLITRVRGRWTSGGFSLHGWGAPINAVAVVWLVIAGVNVGWPRSPFQPWYVNWAVPLGAFTLLGVGMAAYFACRGGMRVDRPEPMALAANCREG